MKKIVSGVVLLAVGGIIALFIIRKKSNKKIKKI